MDHDSEAADSLTPPFVTCQMDCHQSQLHYGFGRAALSQNLINSSWIQVDTTSLCVSQGAGLLWSQIRFKWAYDLHFCVTQKQLYQL